MWWGRLLLRCEVNVDELELRAVGKEEGGGVELASHAGQRSEDRAPIEAEAELPCVKVEVHAEGVPRAQGWQVLGFDAAMRGMRKRFC